MVLSQAKKHKGAKICSMNIWLDDSWSEGMGQSSNPDKVLKKIDSCSVFNIEIGLLKFPIKWLIIA